MIDLAPTPTYIQEKRACIAAFMDAYPDIFAAPTQAVSWSGFVEQATPPDEREERILDQATGRIVQAIRSAQDRTPSDFDMKSMLDQAKDEGFGELQADPGVLEIAAGEHLDEDVATMARAMTLYKEAMDVESAHRPRDGSVDVSQQVAYRQLAGIVDVTLSGLSPDLRGTFDLACLQEESYRDVAEIQAIPIGTVRSRVNRVRTLLRSRLKQGFADYAT